MRIRLLTCVWVALLGCTMIWSVHGYKRMKGRVIAYENVMPPKLIEKMMPDIDALTKYEDSFASLKDYKKHTRWFPAGATPRIVLEEAIVRFIELVKPGRSGLEHVGTEYWIQKVPAGQNGKIGFHLDKDEGIASNKRRLVHPEFSTIFYLTDSGGCTLIFDQYSPTGNGYEPEEPHEGELICPRKNKFAMFNGTLLHGVLPGRPDHIVEPYRITFLMNYWYQVPEAPNCERLKYKEVPGLTYLTKKKLARLRDEIDEDADYTPARKRQQFTKVNLTPGHENVEHYKFDYELPGGRHESIPLPKDTPAGSSFSISWKSKRKDEL